MYKWSVALLMATLVLLLACPALASQDANVDSVYPTIMGGYDTTTLWGIGLRDEGSNAIVAVKTNFFFFATFRGAFSLQAHNPLMVYADGGIGWALPAYSYYYLWETPAYPYYYPVIGGGVYLRLQDHILLDLGLDILMTPYGVVPFPSVGVVFYL